MLVKKWLHSQLRRQPTGLWILIAVALLMWLGLGAVMPIRTIYAEREGATLVEIGLMGSAFLITQFIFQIPFGRFNDKWGRRPFIIFAVFAHAVLTAAYVMFDSPTWFIVVRALEGIGAAAFMPAARAYISDVVPSEKRGEAFGLLGAALSGGILLGPAIGGFIGGAFGFTMPFVFCGISGVAAALLVVFFLPESYHSAKNTETLVKQRSSGISREMFGIYFLGAYALMFAIQFVMSLMGTVWNIWLNDQGDSLNQIGLTYTVFGLPALLFTPYFGRLIDRSHRRANFLLLGGVLVSFVYVGYGLATGHFWLIIVLSLFESLLLALVQPVSDRYTADIIPANARGAGQALFSTFSTLGGFAGAMLTTTTYEFWVGAPFVMAGSIQLAGTVAGGLIIRRYERHHPLATPQKETVPLETADLAVING